MKPPIGDPTFLLGLPALGLLLLALLPILSRRFLFTTGEYVLATWVAWLLLILPPLSALEEHTLLWQEHARCCGGIMGWLPCNLTTSWDRFAFLFPYFWIGGLAVFGLYHAFREVRGILRWHRLTRGLPEQARGPYRVRFLPEDRPFLGVYGFFRPTFLVSRGALACLTEAELDAAIHHEVGHLRRGHLWKEWALRFLLLPLPPPLFSWVLRGFVTLRELEADVEVSDRLSLASALLKVAEGVKIAAAAALQGAGKKSLTSLRLELLLGLKPFPQRRWILGVLWKGTLLAAFLAFWMNHSFASPPSLSPDACPAPVVSPSPPNLCAPVLCWDEREAHPSFSTSSWKLWTSMGASPRALERGR